MSLELYKIFLPQLYASNPQQYLYSSICFGVFEFLFVSLLYLIKFLFLHCFFGCSAKLNITDAVL